MVNASAAYFIPPQNSRFFAISSENMRFKKSVKYRLGAIGRRQINSEDIPGTANVPVTANAVSGVQNNSVLEQIVGRLSLEPYVSAAKWRIERAIVDEDVKSPASPLILPEGR
jgi:hypothetical protein